MTVIRKQRGMCKRNMILCMIAVLSGLVPGQTAAQRINSPYRFMNSKQAVTPYVGYLLTGKGSLDLGPGSGALFGARYTISVSGPFALEASASYFSQIRAVQDTVAGDTTRVTVGDADFSTFLATAALRFNLTGARTYHGIQPYVLFGLGVGVDASSASPAETNLPADVRFDFGTSFMGLLGGGADIVLTDRFGLSLDARNLLWKLKTPEAFFRQGEGTRLLPGDEWAQNFSLSAGLVFRF